MNQPDPFITTKRISQAIVLAQAEIRAAGKSGDNKFDKYTYAKLEDFFLAAKPIMAKHGLALLVSVESCETLPDRATKNGGLEHAVRVRLAGNLVHESGESLTVTGYGEGQDRADKALYKAITGGKKYLLASLFSIPTTDDPEADETVGQSGPAAKAKVATKTGEVKSRKPTWTPEQTKEGGAYRQALMEALGDDTYQLADKELTKLLRDMAYDEPEDVLAEVKKLHDRWLDIHDQATTKDNA